MMAFNTLFSAYFKIIEIRNRFIEECVNIKDNVEEMIDAKNYLSDDVLLIAAYIGNITILKYYIAKGVDVNKKGNAQKLKKYTPLRMAVLNRQYETVKFLIEAGANTSFPLMGTCYGGCTILHTALDNLDKCQPESYDNLKLLLHDNPDVNHSCGHLRDPLAIAITNDDQKLIDMLLEYGADVDTEHLFLTVIRKESEILKLLLNHSANVNILLRDKSIIYGIEPVDDNVKIISYILIAGFNLNSIDLDRLIDIPLGAFSRTVIEHLVKMKAANFFFNKNSAKILNTWKFDEFFASCCRDIELMKKNKIAHTHVSFYDLLHTKEYIIASRIKCVTKDNILNYREEFPLYYEIIDYKLNRVLIRQNWFNKVNCFLDHVFWNILPTHFVWSISSYFSEIYLKKLNKQL